jgi:hypothetical protein
VLFEANPREVAEDVGLAGDSELPPELLTCALVFGIGENCRSFASLRMTG